MGIFNDNSQNNNTGGSGQPGLPGQKGDPGIGFKLTADGNFDLDNKQIKNLSGGTDKSDAVNYSQLLEHTENHQNNYHLQKSFTFYKNFGDKAQLNIQNINITNHNHHDLLVVKKEGSDPGFYGEAWVSLKMTNDLPVGIYTVVFELFSGISGISGSVTQLNNETLFQQVHGDANYEIIIFSHDYQTTHSKAFIQFTSNGQAGEITFQIRYYGSSYNNPNLNFLFFSRVLAGKQGTAFNHNLFDVDDVQLVNQILYFEDVNLNGNKIKGLAEPSEDSHAVNMKYVNNQIQTQVNSLFSKNSHSYNLQPNFTFVSPHLGSFFHNGREGTLIHNHGIWKKVTPVVISIQYFELNFYAQHNNLKPGNYTALFELYSLYNGSEINDASIMTFYNTAANSNYKFIQLKSRSVDNNYKKIIMQFKVIRNPGVLNGNLKFRRFPGSLITKVRFVFFHRIIEGLYDLDFDHGVFDADPQQLFFIDSLSLNNKRLTDVADPTDPKDSANKTYVDDEIAKLPHSDNGILKLDGSRAMTGNLNMGYHTITGIKSSSADNAALTVGSAKATYLPLSGNRAMHGTLNMSGYSIKNIRPFVEDDSSQAASDAQKYDVVNWGKIHEIRGDLKREINAVEYEALNRINPDPMEDDIDMGNNFITNIKDPLPSNSNYATTVNFVNKTVSDNNTTISTLIDSKINERDHLNIKAAKQENVFSFVMIDDLFKEDDSDITKVGKVNKDFYDIHKETYQFNIRYDGNIGYYSTRTGIDLKAIDLGEYTLVFEMYFDGSKIDKNEVIVNAVSTPLNISRNRTNKFADHSRTVINFHKYGNIGIIDLDIDITMKNKGGISYDPTTTIYVIVYGVSGHQNDVDSGVWDRVYYIENNAVKFEATIDMDNHNIGMKNGQIKGLGDGVENSDAINVKQLNEMESNLGNYMKTEIDKVKTDDTNNHALLLALYNYIMKNRTKVSILKDLYFTDSQETKTSNTYLFNFNNHLDSSNQNNFTFYYVFKHNTTSGTGNEASIAMQWKKSNLFIHLFIHVTLNRIIISISPLVSPSFISSINIPKEALEKQIWFWIWMQGTTFYLITSGNNTFTHNLRNIGLGADYQFVKFNVDDSPFPKIRGLITSNVYDYNSEAYVKAREFERAQGTII